VPEGRIKPGNVFQRLFVSSFIVPLFFRDTDVGVGGGVGLTDIDFRRTRRKEFAGVFLTYTSEGQARASAVWRRWLHHVELPGGGILQEERSFWRARAEYSRTLTRRFFGLGPDSNADDETSYTDELVELGGGLSLALPRPGSDWVLDVGARMELHELSAGEVGGQPSTDDAFPEIFEDAESRDLGWLVAGIAYDTRDSQLNPYSGWHVELQGELAAVQSNGEVGSRVRLEASHVLPLPGLFHSGGTPDEEHPPTDVLALAARLDQAGGDLPFFALPSLGGGDTLRGFIAGRFRGDSSWTTAAEYRFWLLPRGIPITRSVRIERVGLALFAEAGAVANHFQALARSDVRWSAGIGGRLTLERQAPFRVDVGFSSEGVEVTAGFGLAF